MRLKYSNYDIRMQMRPQKKEEKKKFAEKTGDVVLLAFYACTHMRSYMQVSLRMTSS